MGGIQADKCYFITASYAVKRTHCVFTDAFQLNDSPVLFKPLILFLFSCTVQETTKSLCVFLPVRLNSTSSK